MDADFQAACLVDEPADDYESWRGELPEEHHEDKLITYVHGLWVSKVETSLTSRLEGAGPKPLLLKAVKYWC